MKRILIIILGVTVLMPAISKSQQHDFSIKVQLEGLGAKDTLFLISFSDKEDWDSRFPIAVDTVAEQKIRKNRILSYSDKLVTDGKMYALRISGKKGVAMILVSAGEKIMVSGIIDKWPDVEINGSKGTADLLNYQKIFAPLVVAKKVAEAAEFRSQFLATNTNSLYAAFVILMSKEMTVTERKAAYDRLTPYVKDSYFGLKIANATKGDTLYEAIKEGNTIPNFKVKTTEGQTVSIRELISQSKYTLIDLWASWCIPCRKGFPELLKADRAYRNKGLSIVGVAVMDKDTAWKKALSEEESTWTQVFDKEGKVERLFKLSAIPGIILVDQQGKLIAVNCTNNFFGAKLRGEELFKTMDELLK